MNAPPCLLVLVLGLASASLHAQCATNWLASSAVGGEVRALLRMPNGDVVAGGNFTSIGGVAALGIARRSTGAWTSLGSGVPGVVRALALLPNGDLVAGGEFPTAGGVTVNHIARWNGTTWSALGSGMAGSFSGLQPTAVHALLVDPNGDLLVGGHFTTAGGVVVGDPAMQAAGHLARWNGSAWSSVGGGVSWSHLNPAPTVDSMALLPNGDLVVAGQFTLAGAPSTGGPVLGRLARWTGATWASMAAGWPVSGIEQPVPTLLVQPNGDLFAGGGENVFSLPTSFQNPLVARWTGSTWTPLGALGSVGSTNSRVFALLSLPNGDLLAAGRAVGNAVNTVGRWNGSSWTSAAAGLLGEARAMLTEADGTVLVGGNFSGAVAVPSPGLLQLASSCPAAVAISGPGCVGSAGPCTLTATSLPWLGSTYHSVIGGMPANSLGIVVLSLSPQVIALSAVLPIAGAGCDGLLQVATADLVLPAGGTTAFTLPLPDQPALSGLVLHQYAAILEFATGNAIALYATNRLALQLGAF